MSRILRNAVTIALVALLAAPVSATSPAAAASSSPTPSASAQPRPGTSGSTKAAVVTFGVEPASATGRDGRGYYAFGATPGALITDHVAVLNFSTTAVSLSVLATDATNTDSGGITGLTEREKPTDIGSWIVLRGASRPLRVPAATATGPGQVVLPFTLRVPADATPGDHSGLVLATLSTFAKDSHGVNVRLDQRVGTRVFLRVSGTLRPALAIDHLAATFHLARNPLHAGSTSVTFELTNTGNVKLGGAVTVDVAGLVGQHAHNDVPARVPLLLPGNSVAMSVEVPGTYPELREIVTATVTPIIAKGDLDGSLTPVTAQVQVWAVPWPLLALVLAALLGMLVLWRVRRRRHEPDAVNGPPNPREPELVGVGRQGP